MRFWDWLRDSSEYYVKKFLGGKLVIVKFCFYVIQDFYDSSEVFRKGRLHRYALGSGFCFEKGYLRVIRPVADCGPFFFVMEDDGWKIFFRRLVLTASF